MSGRRAKCPAVRRYNREGLFGWARERFPEGKNKLSEEDFRTQSRLRLMETLLEVSRSVYPEKDETKIDEQLEAAFRGTTLSEAGDAHDLAAWAKSELKLDIPEAQLTGVTQEVARQILWNAFDLKYRPEMRGLERNLLLNNLDSHWKNHLYTMDHLRSGVGLRGYGQEDPKIVYKQEGMKEFRIMWDNLEDKVSETIFRMEETEAFQDSVWTITEAVHEAAPKARLEDGPQLSTNSGTSDKKAEPIRNRGEKVGRNDPCPCGSGKKYKNCHMRQAV